MGEQSKREKINVDLTGTDLKSEIERWAAKEQRSVSATIRILLQEALQARENQNTQRIVSDSQTVDAVAKILIWDTDDLATKAGIPPERVDLIQRGERPTLEEVIRLARLLKVKPSELKTLFEKQPFDASRR